MEDMLSLATANFVDVILHTRVPVGRLVDWVDQAHLYLHLDRLEGTWRERKHARAGRGPRNGDSQSRPKPAAHPDGLPAEAVQAGSKTQFTGNATAKALTSAHGQFPCPQRLLPESRLPDTGAARGTTGSVL